MLNTAADAGAIYEKQSTVITVDSTAVRDGNGKESSWWCGGGAVLTLAGFVAALIACTLAVVVYSGHRRMGMEVDVASPSATHRRLVLSPSGPGACRTGYI
jgi:hypothetical protein